MQTFEELPEMHPLDFRDYWGLTNEETAYYLRLTAAAILSYETSIIAKKRSPSYQVMGLAGELHQKWLAGNRERKQRRLQKPSYSGSYRQLATA
jgi:hypothetical protein